MYLRVEVQRDKCVKKPRYHLPSAQQELTNGYPRSTSRRADSLCGLRLREPAKGFARRQSSLPGSSSIFSESSLRKNARRAFALFAFRPVIFSTPVLVLLRI